VLVAQAAAEEVSDQYSTAWHQLRAELTADGFDVVVGADGGPSPAALERLASETESFAAVRVSPGEDQLSAEVWITDSRSGRSIVHRVTAQGQNREAARELALRTAELLGASVLVLSVTSDEPRRARRFGAWFGAAILGHPGGLPVAAAPAAGAHYRLTESLALELRLMMPALSEGSTIHGRAEFDQELVLLGGRFETRLGDPLFVLASAAYGAYRVGVRGRPAPPLVGRSQHEIVSAAAFGAGIGLHLARSRNVDVRLVLREDVVALMPRPVVLFNQASLAKTGQPMLIASGGLEVLW
jgi:hypothetical protein